LLILIVDDRSQKFRFIILLSSLKVSARASFANGSSSVYPIQIIGRKKSRLASKEYFKMIA
jgi:hypothetical protein